MTNKLSAFANIVSAEKQSDEWLDLAGYEHRPVTSAMLRGGRMTKQHGVVASYSPELGVSVAVDGAAGGETSLIGRALAALRWGAAPAAIAASGLVGASSALAQDACVETTPGSGVFVCEDNGAPATTTQDLFGFLGSDTTIEDGFEVDTTGVGGNGLEARSNGGIAIRQASGTSTVTGDVGIDVENFVNDGITVQTGGAVTGTVAQGIRAENNSGPTTSFIIIDSTAGTVTGATSGISVDNAGNGAIEVTTADVVALNGIGIGAGDDLLNPGTSVFVDSSAGSVSGTAGGITASNYGSGSATVITGDVSATSGFGIRLNTRGGMTTIDTSAGSVTATGDGIDVSSRSTAGDLLTITTGSVSGTFGDGIAASGGGDVTVDTSAGSVSGGQHGLLVENFLGTLSIVTGDVTGSSEEAIEVDGAFTTFVGDLSIDTTAGTVSGGRGGVVVFTSGSGSNTVRTADVSATGGVAIDVRTGGSDLTIDTTAGSVIGELGVRAGLSGISGNVEIRTGNVTSTAGTAVAAFSGRDSDIEIDTSAGSLSSQGDGIRVSNSGTGDITVTTGNITSASYGVYVEMGGVFDPSGGDISIDTSGGVVDAGSRGIRVRNYGPGTTTLTVNDVSSNYGPAIQARSSQASASITVRGSSGDIVGATDGIYLSTQMAPILVENLDSVTGQNGLGLNLRTIGGSITVNDIGLVAGTFGSVLAQSQGGAITITGIGELDGILNANSYGGNISIQDIGQSGGIGGAYGAGILANARAFGNGSGGNIEIGTTGAIGDIFSVYGFGISATTDGLGTVTIDSSGGTINSAGRGIDVNLASGDGAISITTGDVDARQDGVYVRSNGAGSGAVTIDTSGGSISSTYSRGIYVNSSYSPVSIVTGDITANTYGIQSRNFGADVLVDTSQGTVSGVTTGVGVFHSGTTGAVSVITGATSGTSRYGTAVVATGTGLTIDTSAGSATGGTWGVVGISNGSGATSVTTADATGFTRDGVFVAANSGMGTNVSVDTSAGTVIGQYDGIDSYNGGIGSHTIITADVTGTNFAGIFAQNSALGTNFTVDSSAGSVIGGNDGIDLDQYGSGALTITTADVTGTIGDGIDARSYGTELSIDTSAGTVSGATNGIFVVQRGTGAVTLTVNDVTGYGGYGISATSTAGNAHITVRGSSGDIVGATDGIYTRTLGADITVDNLDSVTGQAGDGLDLGSVGGAVTVSDIGTITGNGGAGIRIDSAGGDISIQGVGTVGGVTGTAGSGIYANASIFGADGHINIGDVDAIGAVSGTDDGIYARTSGAGSITIVASGDVTGGNRGVLAITYDTGAISIDSTGVAVSGGFDNGIQAANINGSGSITVTTGDVSSTYGDGVYVGAYLGDTTIDTTGGAVTAGANGITARNGIGATSMSISTGDITATNFGVYARAQTGDLDVDTTSGDVNADNFALVILSDDGGATSLTAGNVTSTNGTGVFARSRGNSTSLTVDTTAGSIQGQYSGVVARQEGTGTLTVTTADTNATGYSGIFALTYGSDATVDSTAGTTSGGNFGVYALNRGTGSLTITTADAFGTDFDGVYADAAGGTTDLTIDSSAGSVSGGRNGIYARDAGSGILTITTADVAGGSFAGIRARKIAGTDLLIDTTAGSVNGANSGINASLDYATGSVSVATGAVTATAGMGVSVTNSAYGANLLIDTTGGPVVGSLSGVYARNDGSGYTSVITADVTGRTFDGVDVRAQGTDVIVDTAAGTVIGQQSGVSVQHQGTGTVDVTTADVTGTYAVGVAISSIGNGINLDTSAGTVTGGSNGISVTNDGYGPTSITTAAVVGNGSYGILVRSYATAGDVTIDSSAGPVSGNDNGIRATQYGAGGLSITSADATGNYGRGIYAYLGGFSTGNLVIDSSAGSVLGQSDGIYALNFGSGDASITTGTVLGTYGNGIDLGNFGTNAAIDSSAGTVSGSYGINARNYGSGVLTITTADVDGIGSDGIYASNDGTDLIIDSSAGTVTGNNRGITARSFGYYSSELAITTADVVGQYDAGIFGVQYGYNGGLTIDSSAGSVTGGSDGILARNYGIGALTITTADATGNSGYGIIATQYNYGSDLTIDSTAGSVSGTGSGIFARSFGTGALSINSADVAGDGFAGIIGRGYGTDVTIDSSAGSVTGRFDGIEARNNGTGALTVTTADITGTLDDGIFAFNTGTDLIIDTSAGAVSGNYEAIEARNYGSGILSITTADISATFFDGIFANNFGTELNIDTTAGAINANRLGIFANQNGTGSLTIATAGVKSTYSIAVYGGTGYSATDFAIDTSAGGVVGNTNGILARHRGTGYLSIISADVTSVTGTAIYGFNSAFGTDLTIDSSAGSVGAPAYGIDARQYGSGVLSITSADVTSANSRAIRATNSNAGTDLIIDSSAGSVRGNTDGIFADNRGSGVLTVISGDVTADTLNGIFAANYGTDLLIDSTAGAVNGVNSGIFVIDNGSGTGTIRTADVTATSGNAINASFEATGTDVLIDTSAGTVTGSNIGINGSNDGSGSTMLITADVIATGFNGISFNAAGSDFTIDTTAGQVTGQTEGIRAINTGSGTLSATTGDVAGLTGDGIFLLNDGSDTVLDISGGSVSGGSDGVRVSHLGSGSATIVTADVTGLTGTGISVGGSGTDVTLDTTAGTVSGDGRGIFVSNSGTGALAVSTAMVTGNTGDGILAINSVNGTDVSVDTSAASVSGSYDGVEVFNFGNGATTVTTADVNSIIDDGVFVRGDGTDLSVDTSAGAIGGGTEGVVALNNGTGALAIKSADVTGATGDGIYATGSSSGTDLTIDTSAGTTTGALQGIDARQYGSGALTITVNDVNGLAAEAIRAISTQIAASVTVQGSSGDVTGATDGIAVVTAGADITVDNLDSVNGQAGNGLDLASSGGAIFVGDIGGITGTGANGILADSDGGAISVDAVGLTGGVTGTAGAGIFADATGGSGGAIAIGTTTAIGHVTGSTNAVTALTDGSGRIAIDTSAGSASGGVNGIYANNAGSGATSLTVAEVVGMTNAGILVTTTGSSLSIDTTAGTVMGEVGGILAENSGSGATAISTADVMSVSGVAILVEASGSDLEIDTTAGTISGAQAGIIAENTGNGATSITTADILGGIDIAGAGTDANIDSTAGTVIGALDGILLEHTGSGTASIVTRTVAGMNGFGIVAETSGSGLAIDTRAGVVQGGIGGIIAENTGTGASSIVTGDILGVSGAAIEVIAGTATTGLTINATGNTMGGVTGISAENNGTGPTMIVNDGTLMATSGEAILLSGAGAGIVNNGSLFGFVTLGDSDDTLTNNGTFTAEGDGDFGLGTDLLANNGDFAVASGGSLALNGLESFANSGLVSLADNAIGNNLSISGDFAGSGGSILGIDVDFAAGAADFLTVGGAATGSTTLGINAIGGAPTTLFADILVVDAGAGSTDTAFALMGGTQTVGLIQFDLAFDASNNDYFIATAPSLAAFQTSNLLETARGVWQQSADAFSAQMATDRDRSQGGSNNLAGGQESAARAWIAGFGSEVERERDLNSTANGLTGQFDLGYDQDAFGILTGVDFGSQTLRYGLTGGYLSSEVRFAGTPNRVEYDVLTIGAYLALDTGPFFANALVKYDNINGQFSSATGGVASELDGSAFGVQGELGALLGDRTGFFFEPSASFAYSNADLDTLSTSQGTFAFEEGDSLLGRVGARLGSGFSSGDTPGTIYLGARYVHEFEGEDSVIFASGGQMATFGSLPVDDYAELTAGVSLGGEEDALSGGLRGQVLIGEDVSGFGVSANIRFRF